jgi:acetyltransferase-like isoleucine patch superfamily enzyme
MFNFIVQLIKNYYLKRLKTQGLHISSDCRIMGLPGFGFPDFDSEPYLISIGNHVEISTNVSFVTHDGATWVFRDQLEYKDVIKYGRITIHDNCFIGTRSILMPGIQVGPNSVIAAGAVVTKDVPPGVIVAGCPAHIIKTVDEYAKECLKNNPEYHVENYKKNKIKEILRIYPSH